jgi:hypothetical protein
MLPDELRPERGSLRARRTVPVDRAWAVSTFLAMRLCGSRGLTAW